MANPFPFEAPVGPEALIDRDAEARELVERAVGGHNSRLVAPRRYGKTSLLHRAIRDAGDEGWIGVYINFFGVLTPGDVAERVDRAYDSQLQSGLAGWLDGVRRALSPTVRLGGGPLPAEIELGGDPQGQRPMLERLGLPVRVHERTGRRVLVVFDEFQDVLAAGNRIDAVIRSEIEQHGAAASYVFAGSHVGMMHELFSSQRRAFYGQAGALELAPLPPVDVAEHLEAAFRSTSKDIGEALGPLLDVAQGHPQRTMLLAHRVWELTPAGGAADEGTFFAALERVMDSDVRNELRPLWAELPAGQRKVLALIAADRPLNGVAAQREFNLPRGGGVRTTVQALIDRGDVVPDRDRASRHRLVDPLLARWVLEGRPSST